MKTLNTNIMKTLNEIRIETLSANIMRTLSRTIVNTLNTNLRKTLSSNGIETLSTTSMKTLSANIMNSLNVNIRKTLSTTSMKSLNATRIETFDLDFLRSDLLDCKKSNKFLGCILINKHGIEGTFLNCIAYKDNNEVIITNGYDIIYRESGKGYEKSLYESNTFKLGYHTSHIIDILKENLALEPR